MIEAVVWSAPRSLMPSSQMTCVSPERPSTSRAAAADYTPPRRPDGTRAYAFDSSKVHTFDLTQPQVGGRFPEVGTGTTAAPGSRPPVASGAKSTAEALLSFGGQFARGHLLVDGSQRAQVRDERVEIRLSHSREVRDVARHRIRHRLSVLETRAFAERVLQLRIAILADAEIGVRREIGGPDLADAFRTERFVRSSHERIVVFTLGAPAAKRVTFLAVAQVHEVLAVRDAVFRVGGRDVLCRLVVQEAEPQGPFGHGRDLAIEWRPHLTNLGDRAQPGDDGADVGVGHVAVTGERHHREEHIPLVVHA